MQLSHKALFDKYTDPEVVNKAEQYAKWTLPQLMPKLTGYKTTARLERDYQSVGALLTNNLASKLCALLFPSSRPFYKIKAGEALLEAAKKKGIEDTDLAAGLAKMELASCKQLFLNASYAQLIFALKHLIVTGNVLIHRDSDTAKTTTYGLRSFVVRRDGRGNMLDCILREYTDFDGLELPVQQVLRLAQPSRYADPDNPPPVELYTRIKRSLTTKGNPIFTVSQQVDTYDVGTPGQYPEHLCPWQVPTWSLIAGENYGRGLVEDYAGGFAKLSDVSLAATLYSIQAAKVVNLVAPGQGADVDELQEAECGDYVQGSPDSVTAHEGGDAKKGEQMQAEIAAEFGQLARAFMYKANTRDAERVTAYELKQDAMEAENALGGAYSSLSAALQVPFAHVLLTEVNEQALEGLLTGQFKLDIEAGIPALGRQAEVQNLAAAAQDAGGIIPALSQLDPRIDKGRVMDVILRGQSVDSSTIFFTKDELASQQAAVKQEQMGQQQVAQATQLADQQQALQGIQG